MAVTTRLTWLQKKILQNHFGDKKFSLLYKASVHGSSTKDLLNRCCNQGPIVTVIYGENVVSGVYVEDNYREETTVSIIIFVLGETEISECKISECKAESYGLFVNHHNNEEYRINLQSGRVLIPPKIAKSLELPPGHQCSFQECEVFRCEDSVDERKIQGLTQLRGHLLLAMRNYKPYGDLVNQVKILLLGPIGAGKSSFFNSVKSVFQGYVSHQALIGNDTTGTSKNYRVYSMKDRSNGDSLPLVLCDSMGLGEDEEGLCMEDILSIIKGHISDRYQFNSMNPITSSHVKYIEYPQLKDRIHCVAFVFDINSIEHLSYEMVAKIKRIRREMIKCGMLHVVLLTHVDSMKLITRSDLMDIYSCVPVKLKIDAVHSNLGFPVSNILVVSNYSSEWELDAVKDILILSALRRMLWTADDFLEDFPLE
ncbi:interferon-induced protein 44 [Lepus europaeus]|uniref:interferon-induced protein 44 n=1 Tax=Lepus europaeus TaxID=9983 RepID=UPI002B49B54C|nr:interferon-induced protein 44 [Lepus europaeus]